MAIPARDLNAMLLGRVDTVGFHLVKIENGIAEVKVTVALVDPLNKITKALIRVGDFPVSSIPRKREKSGSIPALPDSQAHELKIENRIGTATLKLKAADRATVTRYLVQPVLLRNQQEDNSPLQFVQIENQR